MVGDLSVREDEMVDADLACNPPGIPRVGNSANWTRGE